jgi:thermitase
MEASYLQMGIDKIENIQADEKISSNLSDEFELLVDLKAADDIKKLSDIIDKYELKVEYAFDLESENITTLDDYVAIGIPDHQESKIQNIIQDLKSSGHVDYLESNEYIQLDPLESKSVSETPSKKRNYGINDPGISELWSFERMKMDELYSYIQKNKIKVKEKALIAILDTGVDAGHEDIEGNFISTRRKYNRDKQGHGTHCAGIAAAVSNNKKGVASFSPNNEFVQVTSVKVLSDFGSGTQRGIINGMIEAADKGADVISMSLGGRSAANKQKAYLDAVKYCNDKGAIVIVAAGNNGANAKDISPANVKGVITVSAVDAALNKAVFSNHIKDIGMGIAAPGVNIYSSVPGNEYKKFSGTSMATPYVAGLVGVMKSIKKDLTTKDAYQILKKSGATTNHDKETGKLIQPLGALELLLK